MDVSGCSEAQRTVIGTLPGPLFVAAGAGSGKTFTLKLRTANAFLPNESGFQLDSIQQVLAITFTKAAAAELLSRIKDTLLEEGLEEAAFEADGAWISTIHGFCSRLLRENALEIGLDPEFRMITEREAHQMRDMARTRVLEQVRAGSISLDEVAWNWDVMGAGTHDAGLMDDAEVIAGKTGALPDGTDAFVRLDPAAPAQLLEDLMALAQAVQDVAGGWSKVHGSWEAPSLGAIPGALEVAGAWLASSQARLAFADAAFQPKAFQEVLAAFPALTPAFGKNKDGQDVIERYRRAHARAAYETAGALGLAGAEAALRLSEAVQGEFSALKRAANVVDDDDLLAMALEALRQHPQVAERYREQFKLIMVDEFQDTDKVQIEILKLIAQPQLANVCVVGDAQQSIYRFRGADVGSFADYRDELARSFPQLEEKELQPKLDQNFRSHADILAFVDAVFGQACSFGSAYLKLAPKGAVNRETDAVMDDRPRVQLDVIHHPKGADGLKEQALRASARGIAQHFADLRQAAADRDASQRRSFALLLGTTRNAQVYIDALRDAGMESMMTSGSILMGSHEALMVSALLQLAVNRQDGQPLLDCLTSELFALSDDALLALAYWKDDAGAVHHGRLAQGFWGHGEEAWDLPVDEMQAIQLAREVLQQFVQRARCGSVTEAVRGVLVASGYLDRMQARGVSGLASVGNCSKLLDLLKGVERETAGLAEALSGFQAKASLANESPGVLSVAEADFVQIMTIHGSKGLQFDHVALADIKPGKEQARGLLAENEGASAFAISKKGLAVSSKLKGTADALADEAGRTRLHDARTPGQLLHQLERTVQTEGLAEARRLLYVGLTRAVRSLYVAYVTSSAPQPKKGAPYGGDGVMREVHEALCWDTAPEGSGSVQEVAYGGSQPAQVRVTVLRKEDETASDPVSEQQEGEAFVVPLRRSMELPPVVPFRGARAKVRSYSSLSSSEESEGAAAPYAGMDDADDARALAREAGEDATALGAAFHRLAQRAILERNARGVGRLEMPPAAAVEAQVQKLGLNPSQAARLGEALFAWFASEPAERLSAADSLEAEVPFLVRLERDGSEPCFLEGEVDALAACGDAAFFVDYKTGGFAWETEEQIRAKHELQAQCYAYALLRRGFASVEGAFIRVEQAAESGGLQTVIYRFAPDDLPILEQSIISAFP